MTRKWRGAWDDAEPFEPDISPPAPEPVPIPPPATIRVATRRLGSRKPIPNSARQALAREQGLRMQLAQALVDEVEGREWTLAQASKALGVCVWTVRAHRYGSAMRLETLERIAEALGWTITIQDATGREIVRC